MAASTATTIIQRRARYDAHIGVDGVEIVDMLELGPWPAEWQKWE